MKGPLILLGHSLKRSRTLVLAIGVILAAFQVLLIVIARSFYKSDAFEQIGRLLPPFFREMFGGYLASFLSFTGMVCLGYFHPAVVGSLVALCITLATMPAREIESGFMDLMLSRPLARHWIITRAIVLVLIYVLALLAAMLAGTWAGLSAFGPADARWPTPRLILSLALNLGLLVLGWSGVALAIASLSRRRGVAAGIAGLLALGMFLLDYVARAWPPAEWIAWLSPFRYYSPFDLLLGKPLPAGHLLLLGGLALGGFGIAYAVFSRRDL